MIVKQIREALFIGFHPLYGVFLPVYFAEFVYVVFNQFNGAGFCPLKPADVNKIPATVSNRDIWFLL